MYTAYKPANLFNTIASCSVSSSFLLCLLLIFIFTLPGFATFPLVYFYEKFLPETREFQTLKEWPPVSPSRDKFVPENWEGNLNLGILIWAVIYIQTWRIFLWEIIRDWYLKSTIDSSNRAVPSLLRNALWNNLWFRGTLHYYLAYSYKQSEASSCINASIATHGSGAQRRRSFFERNSRQQTSEKQHTGEEQIHSENSKTRSTTSNQTSWLNTTLNIIVVPTKHRGNISSIIATSKTTS